MKHFRKYFVIFVDSLKRKRFKYAGMMLNLIIFGKDVEGGREIKDKYFIGTYSNWRNRKRFNSASEEQ